MITVLSLMLSFAVAPAVSKVTANYLVSQLLFPALCLQHYDCIDFLISQKWKRLSFCHDRRENDRCDFTLKIAFNVFAFFFIHLLEIRDADIIFFQFFHDFIVNDISATVQFSDYGIGVVLVDCL